MKQHTVALCFLFILVPCGVPLSAHADDGVLDNDPNGFKGYSWDTNIEQIDGLVLWGESGDRYGSKTYYFPHEPLTLDHIKVENILYSFYGDKFKRVTIKYHDEENYDGLVSAMTDRFGVGKDESQYSNDVTWAGMHTHMIVRYDNEFNIGALVVSQLAHKPR